MRKRRERRGRGGCSKAHRGRHELEENGKQVRRFGSDNRSIKLNVYVVALGNWHHCAASPSGEHRGAR
jgi:hypothetical protein